MCLRHLPTWLHFRGLIRGAYLSTDFTYQSNPWMPCRTLSSLRASISQPAMLSANSSTPPIPTLPRVKTNDLIFALPATTFKHEPRTPVFYHADVYPLCRRTGFFCQIYCHCWMGVGR